MNHISIIGRLTRDPETRYTNSGTAITTFTVAIDRGKDKNGNDRGADFPRVQVWGRQAENCERYLSKGSLIGVEGKIKTGSYENAQGQKVYTTDIEASRVEFLSQRNENQQKQTPATEPSGNAQAFSTQPPTQEPQEFQTQMMGGGLSPITDDTIPF